MERLAIVARNIGTTNRGLLEAAARLGLDAGVLALEQALRRLRKGDVALGRLDVLPTLDGPEPGLDTPRHLEEDVHVLNRAGALFRAHDKLATALTLSARGLPHPRTAYVAGPADSPFELPVVVKPRFGSWGRDIIVCNSRSDFARCLSELGRAARFRHQGALVQELVQPQGYDLRILVAAGEIVGAVKRVAAAGEWRTNVALGGLRASAAPPPHASRLALEAAAALGSDLVGVDLLPDGYGGWVVLELNGAVDFTNEYSLGGTSVFARVMTVLARSVRGRTESPEPVRELQRARPRRAAVGSGRGTQLFYFSGEMRDPIPVYVHLRRVKDLIDRDYALQLDVPALAREAHASRAHFIRSFKSAFGETPHQYLLRRRVERAMELLRGTGLSVTEVSVAVGFRSLGSFSTAFRALVDEPPRDYAARWRAADAPAIPACFTLMYTRPHPSTFREAERGEAAVGSVAIDSKEERR